MASKQPQLLPLTSLRFFLAMWVVVYHETGYWGYLVHWVQSAPSALFSFCRTGYAAVGVFFVLSGFVLAYNYSLETRWPSEARSRFWIARFARIYPAYCAGLLLFLPFVAKGLYNTFTPGHAAHQAVVAILNWTLLQSWSPWAALSWNGPGWSLSDEAFFYFCFPFIGVLLWRLARVRSMVAAFLFVWVAGLIVPAIVVMKRVHGFGDVPATTVGIGFHPVLLPFVLYNPLFELPYFCAGILLARMYNLLKGSKHWLMGRGHWMYLPALALGGLALFQAGRLPFPLVHNGLLLPLDGLAILGLAVGGGTLARVFSWRVLVFLGDASYAIYILHNPIKFLMEYAAKRLHFHFDGTGAAAIYTAIVLVVSAVFFQWVEKPMNRYLRARLGSWLDRRGNAKRSDTAPQPEVV